MVLFIRAFGSDSDYLIIKYIMRIQTYDIMVIDRYLGIEKRRKTNETAKQNMGKYSADIKFILPLMP